MTRAPFAGRRILGLFAHPDDEAYATGGTLALCARGGARVTVACATRGEAGSGASTPELLAERRTRELALSCRILGARQPSFLGLPDGRLGQMEERVFVRRIGRLLLKERPQVVLTLGWDGAYGHIDHIVLTHRLTNVVRRLDQPLAPRVLHAAFPKGLFLPFCLAFRKSFPQLTARLDSETIGTEARLVDLSVDITSVRQLKLEAIAAHCSQLPGGDPTAFLWPGLVEKLLDSEWFTLAAGAPLPKGACDPFAGL